MTAAGAVRIPFPEEALPGLWEAQARRTPSAAAVISRQGRLSFAEFDGRVRELASYFAGLGLRRGVRAGVCLPSSPDLIVALGAILKTGAAFVPLDAGAPAARLHHILTDAGVRLVITERPAGDFGHPQVVTISVQKHGAAADHAAIPDAIEEPLAGDEAYLVYTSGSTGAPKGVVRSHRAIASRLAWAAYGAGDVLCHNMPLTGGLSQERLFVPLMMGASLAVVPEEAFGDPAALAREVEALGITELTVVPRVLAGLADLNSADRSRLRSLRVIMVGGDELSAKLVGAAKAAWPDVSLINTYGSTELGSVIRAMMRGEQEVVAIGKPLTNVSVEILDEYQRPVLPGQAGELCVSSPSLADRYLNLPQLTAERFLPRFGTDEKLFRTGDRARVLPSGEIHLTGRADRQVKIRGFRVELEEIEAALMRLEGVQEAAVACSADRDEARLCAYVAAKPGARLPLEQLRRHAAALLPPHMIPAAFAVLDQLPRGFNGKVDLQSLPELAFLRPALDYPFAPPRDEMEAEIIGVWERVLGISGIGINDHFLHLGGDSLSAVRILAEFGGELGIEIAPGEFVALGTPAAIADRYR